LAQLGDLGLNPVIDYDRLNEIERLGAEATADLAERKARREAGLEPETWRAPPKPEPEEVRAPLTLNVGKLTDAIHTHVEQRILATVEMLGEETGKAEKALRKEVTATATRVEELMRHEMRQGFARNATELMRLRELREANQADLKLSLLDVRKELLEIREQIAELRGVRPRAAVKNGTGAHHDA
jgi:hypothetical protein